MKDQRWILPEGIEEVAPPRAHELEVLRRELVDMYATWGYRLIMPPMVEYLESLLVGTARDLDLDTVKFVDQVSGRMMGIRADIITAGALVAQGALEAFGWDRLTISEGSLREGVLQEAQARLTGEGMGHLADLRHHSVEHLLAAADEDPAHARAVARLSLDLFDGLERVHGLGAEHRELLEAGALLANVGLMISHSAHHKHGYYIITNTDRLTGFNDREIELVAQVARFHRKARPDESRHEEFASLSLVDRAVVRTLAGLLRVAVGLDRSHAGKVGEVAVVVGSDDIRVKASPAEPGGDIDLELYAGAARTGLLADVLGRRVLVEAAGGE